jgi:exosortase
VIPLALGWLAAERVGVMEGRQIVAVVMLLTLFLATLGWRMTRVLSAPLLYLFFLVPFGEFATPVLQRFTAGFIDVGLGVLGIPFTADAFTIEIPEGVFYVAEACAGLRFLIAAVAFGVLYACLIYRSPTKRALFIAASIVIPIVANGVRALGIVVLGHLIGSAQAAAADHLVYGWVFFSVVIVLLIAAGLPFREDGAAYNSVPGPQIRPTRRQSIVGMSVAAIAAWALAAAGPAAAGFIDRSAGGVAAIDPAFAAIPECEKLPDPAPGSVEPGTVVHLFACAAGRLTVTVATLPPRANPAAILATLRRATGELDAEDTEFGVLQTQGVAPESWRLAQTAGPARLTATALWIDGAPSSMGVAFRLRQAWRSVVGASHAVVAIAVSTDGGAAGLAPSAPRGPRASIAKFLEAQTDLSAQVAKLSAVDGAP